MPVALAARGRFSRPVSQILQRCWKSLRDSSSRAKASGVPVGRPHWRTWNLLAAVGQTPAAHRRGRCIRCRRHSECFRLQEVDEEQQQRLRSERANKGRWRTVCCACWTVSAYSNFFIIWALTWPIHKNAWLPLELVATPINRRPLPQGQIAHEKRADRAPGPELNTSDTGLPEQSSHHEGLKPSSIAGNFAYCKTANGKSCICEQLHQSASPQNRPSRSNTRTRRCFAGVRELEPKKKKNDQID